MAGSIAHIGLIHLEPRRLRRGVNIGADHPVPPRHKGIGNAAANKARRAGNKNRVARNSHSVRSFLSDVGFFTAPHEL